MRRRTLAVLATGLLSCGLFCQQSRAAPIQGEIDLGGTVTYDTTSLATATRVNVWKNSVVLRDTGDFATFVTPGPGTFATMAAPWIFNSGTPGSPSPGPATPALWKVGGFTFDLTSSSVVSQSTHFLDIEGVGTVSGHGFDPTPGFWTFTSSRSNGQTSNTFGFQTNNDEVPEGSTVALLGIGGIGLAGGHFLRRKLKKSA
jgi:hypothetical protein